MVDVFEPIHRMWLVRASVAISVLAGVATWLASRGNVPATTQPIGTVASPSPAASPTAIADLARRATVQVVAMGRRGVAIGQGTGFFLSSDGLIATNYHVIESARSLRIETLDGDSLSDVYLVATDTARDLAMLRVARLRGAFLRLASPALPAIGAPVYVMGNPLGQLGTFSTGVVSATRSLPDRDLIQMTAPISPGSSGGPVLNGDGHVVGIATLNLRGGQNMNFAVSSRYLSAMMAERDQAVRFTEAAEAAATVTAPRANTSRQPSSSDRLAIPDEMEAVVDRQFAAGDSLLRSLGYVPDGRILHDALDEGKDNRHPVNINRAGTYLVQAYCDNDCTEMTLALSKASGALAVADDTPSDRPLVVFDPDTTHYTLRIRMVRCSVEPCTYGLRLYRHPPKP